MTDKKKAQRWEVSLTLYVSADTEDVAKTRFRETLGKIQDLGKRVVAKKLKPEPEKTS